MTPKTFSVITTIQAPTACVRALVARLGTEGIPLLVMGDKKGPFSYDLEGAELVTLAQQEQLPFTLAPLLPKGHYVRKNLGYLLAIQRGARRIYETDDDNAPNALWGVRDAAVEAKSIASPGWFNVYRLYTQEHIWPRGLPLNLARREAAFDTAALPDIRLAAPIQQCLANLAPDVDAVWRLLLDREFQFQPGPSAVLARNTWCPFNSQATWWFSPAFELMYLPSHCSFRMTDIWRSFVAQRCLWEFAEGLAFHAADVVQERNVHNLMRDFADEVPGYLQNARIAEILQGLSLKPGEAAVGDNLLACYQALVSAGIFAPAELPMVEAWLADLRAIRQRSQPS